MKPLTMPIWIQKGLPLMYCSYLSLLQNFLEEPLQIQYLNDLLKYDQQ